ncbi:MAG TPA: hypothetical protein VHX13_08870 [Acidobacteriaceae bacterium]|jgi:hypothetical protein|nr:hypothetical protein [Acidobacteriaceae bacterium]
MGILICLGPALQSECTRMCCTNDTVPCCAAVAELAIPEGPVKAGAAERLKVEPIVLESGSLPAWTAAAQPWAEGFRLRAQPESPPRWDLFSLRI